MDESISDRELIERFAGGDNVAYSTLVRRYQNLVYNVCFRVVGQAEAEDLTQDIFIRVMDKAPQWRGQSKFSTWLYTLSLNYCRDWLRRLRPEMVEVEERVVDPGPGPDAQAAAKETGGQIADALIKLPVDYRTVIFLRDIEGFSYREIAQILEVELGTVKSRLARARANLSGLLEQIRPLDHHIR